MSHQATASSTTWGGVSPAVVLAMRAPKRPCLCCGVSRWRVQFVQAGQVCRVCAGTRA